MRRGHPGIGGWRNENARHFRPRGGGTTHYRPPRGYGLLDAPRFPPPSPRLSRGSPYPHSGHLDDLGTIDHHERNRYRGGHQNNHRTHERGHHNRERNILPFIHQKRHKGNSDPDNSFIKSNFYEEANPAYVNNMGDVDHRARSIPFGQRQISPWINSPFDTQRPYYDEHTTHKPRYHDFDERNQIPPVEYTGHRPPSSDHYVGTPGPTTNKSNTAFSRSVDDTVDLVRKRLLNRNESQPLLEDPPVEHNIRDQDERDNINDAYQNIQQEPPVKKRVQRQRQNEKSNCDKIKNKIVHQLFKMDKDKIHKLMDNPNSSTKFEYAISSLITESQNSFNKHLRSVAEKSLCSSSTDFIENDNNTIYEDTFMKQMQCILDPQDTMLLEDIKPLVMAELSKVLQLGNFDQRFEMTEDPSIYQVRDDPSIYQVRNDPSIYQIRDDHTNYNDDICNNEDFLQETLCDRDHSADSNYENSENMSISDETNRNFEYNQQAQYQDSKVLFERRPNIKSCDYSEERRRSSESRQSRRSIDNKSNEDKFRSNQKHLTLFDHNIEQLSEEEEDPFADLDNQYHVAVDHNFIETDDITNPPQSNASNSTTSPILHRHSNIIEVPYHDSSNIKTEIDNQLLSIAKSPLELFASVSSKNEQPHQNNDVHLKKEVNEHLDYTKENMHSPTKNNSVTESKILDNNNLNQDQIPKDKDADKYVEQSENSNYTKPFSTTNPRKRSIDQRPSHRKEKRKKSESSPPDTTKQPLNKNTTINVDCNDKSQDATKSIFNLFFSKDQENKHISKETKKVDSTDKGYSDKYVKRKEQQKKTKEKDSDTSKKRNSSSISHSTVSPKDSSSSAVSSQVLTKSDAKTKLKPIDIFSELPRKVGSVHQSHRNTASTPTVAIKIEKDENKPKSGIFPRKISCKHVGTQVVKRFNTKETQTFDVKHCNSKVCQTESTKLVAKCSQTEDVSFERSKPVSTDAFERMKEIDLEIQVLLQEKFKLYNSLESKHPRDTSTMKTLGMTVLNVTPLDETEQSESNDTEDAIVDDFTSIPVEELEQIAYETIQEKRALLKVTKKSVREKLMRQDRKSSESPTNIKRSNRKAKTPNISLLEQIITDERPLEDIISLDDLESTPLNSKKKPQKGKLKKKPPKKIKVFKTVSNDPYDLKECSVVLRREDIRKYLKPMSTESIIGKPPSSPADVPKAEKPTEDNLLEDSQVEEESVVNDLQFDMLDVSEDIVIGDSCDLKLVGDKDVHQRIDVPISEEIILDNSQSSLEDVFPSDIGHGEIECKMYDYSTDENLRRDSVTVTGNADAVLAIECVENNFIAACLDGNVYHFSGDGQLLNTLRGSNLAVTCLTIVQEKYGTTVYTGSLDSRIRYYDLETGLEKGPECNVLSPIQTMDRAWDTVFVGTRTGFVLQFECKNNMLIPVSTVKFSEQSILALRAMKEGPRKVLLVAARSENVTIKDAQTGLLLRTLDAPNMTVYTLLFEDGKVYCGTSSHQIHVFDYASGSHVGAHEGGKGAVCLRATGGLLFAGCYDGCVYVYREGETRPLAQLRGPSLMLLSLAIVGSKIIAGYKDRSLYIWKIPITILQEMIL